MTTTTAVYEACERAVGAALAARAAFPLKVGLGLEAGVATADAHAQAANNDVHDQAVAWDQAGLAWLRAATAHRGGLPTAEARGLARAASAACLDAADALRAFGVGAPPAPAKPGC